MYPWLSTHRRETRRLQIQSMQAIAAELQAERRLRRLGLVVLALFIAAILALSP